MKYEINNSKCLGRLEKFRFKENTEYGLEFKVKKGIYFNLAGEKVRLTDILKNVEALFFCMDLSMVKIQGSYFIQARPKFVVLFFLAACFIFTYTGLLWDYGNLGYADIIKTIIIFIGQLGFILVGYKKGPEYVLKPLLVNRPRKRSPPTGLRAPLI